MTNAFELVVSGRIDLDGTHRAAVEAPTALFDALAPGARELPLFVMSAAGRSVGLLVAEVFENKDAAQGKLFCDHLKLRSIGLKDGDRVELRPHEVCIATKVELRVPADFSSRDAVRFVGKPLVAGEQTALFTFSGDARPMVVAATSPDGIVVVGPSTKIATAPLGADGARVSYEDIGGLDLEVKRIRELVEYPLSFPEVFERLGVTPPRGIILYGPPGTGKTLIARVLAAEIGASFFAIRGPEIYSKWYGRSEENLRNIFEDAVKRAPSIVVIDELDALVPRRSKTHGDQEQRIVATFLTQMDGLSELSNVVVVGTTNRIDDIDPALRRGGRFGTEVHIGPPDVSGRCHILGIHTRRMPLGDDVAISELAEKTHGFTGADIASLCREAAYNALRRTLKREELENGLALSVSGLTVSRHDFIAALSGVSPSAIKEFAVELPRTSWRDVGGLDEVKQLLVENITYAATRREAFCKVGIKPARGILLYGPPGTGKTLLARAAASECGANFIAIKGPELRSRWLGETEERIRTIFSKARMVAPCIVFFDEIDAAVPIRGRDPTGHVDSIVNQILAEMDGIDSGEGVTIIGATNRIEMLDPAVLRPGRFDCLVQVPLPCTVARRAIFCVHLEGKPLCSDVELDALAEVTAGASGAEIAAVCREASWAALRESGYDAEAVLVQARHLKAAVAQLCAKRKELFADAEKR